MLTEKRKSSAFSVGDHQLGQAASYVDNDVSQNHHFKEFGTTKQLLKQGRVLRAITRSLPVKSVCQNIDTNKTEKRQAPTHQLNGDNSPEASLCITTFSARSTYRNRFVQRCRSLQYSSRRSLLQLIAFSSRLPHTFPKKSSFSLPSFVCTHSCYTKLESCQLYRHFRAALFYVIVRPHFLLFSYSTFLIYTR